jgi:hypothetical protein
MHDPAVHAREHIALDAPLAIREEDSADSTHVKYFRLDSFHSHLVRV